MEGKETYDTTLGLVGTSWTPGTGCLVVRWLTGWLTGRRADRPTS